MYLCKYTSINAEADLGRWSWGGRWGSEEL